MAPDQVPERALAAQAGTDLTAELEASPGGRNLLRADGPEESLLDPGQRIEVVDTLARVLGGAYCHLPQKRAGYAVDPIQALALLSRRCVEMTDGEFHLALTGLVTGLRDAHTRYVGPIALRGKVASLRFLIEQCGPYADPTFIVSKIAANAGIEDPSFTAGVELQSWNGVPFARAVDVYADRETGGRPDARRARALETLTFRALDYGPPPDEQWVILGYRTPDGAAHEVRIPWRVVAPETADTAVNPTSHAAFKVAANPAAESVRRAKKLMFAPAFWNADHTAAGPPDQGALATEFHDVLLARALDTPRGRLGYLRIWSFDVGDHNAFVSEVARLVSALPQDGLILDLRANPGGLIWAAERLLQLFTPRRIAPTRFSLLASPLTRAMAASPFNRLELEAWADSLEEAIPTGEPYSQPLPLTDPDWCNDVGQVYPGPVVAVVDPNTYSSGDLFAAGFVDNRVGPLVSVGRGTGAGGANVWTHAQLRDALADTPHAFPRPPAGIGFTLAIRRAVRSGPADGVPIEDTGIPGIPYAMTRHDLVDGNSDLLAYCADLLATLPSRR